MEASDSRTSVCSRILRRLLCSTLPTQTHPDYQTTLTVPQQHRFIANPIHDAKAATPPPTTTPGVVARLMGLDSFPDHTPLTHTTLGALLRSRSVNSIDFLLHFDPPLPRHRRVRTAVSIPHLPQHAALVEDFNHVSCLKRDNKGGIFQDKRATAKKVEARNMSKKVDLQSTRPPQVKKQLDRDSKRVKKRNNNTKTKVDPQLARPRPKKPPVLPQNGIPHGARKAGTERGTKQVDAEERSKMVEEICRATEEGVQENWDPKFDDFEWEICRQFGQEILHALMKQVVDELRFIS